MLLDEVYHLGNALHKLAEVLLVKVYLVARERCAAVVISALARLSDGQKVVITARSRYIEKVGALACSYGLCCYLFAIVVMVTTVVVSNAINKFGLVILGFR